MKGIRTVFVAALLAASLLCACGMEQLRPDSSPTPEEPSGPIENTPFESEPEEAVSEVLALGPPTPELAVRNNSNLSDDDVDLIQFGSFSGDEEFALIHTSLGEIKVILFRDQAPKAVENFTSLARLGYFDGQIFYKVQPYFLIQTGDPTGTGEGGSSIYRNEEGVPVPFEDEFSLDLWHFRGALTMRSDGPDGNTSRFGIVQAPFVSEPVLEEMRDIYYPSKVIDMYAERGGIPGFDWQHTVFGMVVDNGLEVVDAIAGAATDENDRPLEEIRIESVEIRNLRQPEDPEEVAAEALDDGPGGMTE